VTGAILQARLLGLAGAGCLALAAAAAATALPAFGLKGLVGLAGLAGAVALAMLSGRPREVLLAGYIVVLTYNRQFFGIFVTVFGTPGSEGVYWTYADLMLLALVGTAALQDALGRGAPPHPAPGLATAPVLPLLVVAVLATLAADRPDLAMTDTVRVVKFALVLAWLQRNMDRPMWVTAVAALALVVALQAALGMAQVLLRADGGLSAVLSGQGTADIEEMRFNRASGSLAHPNMLASYLLLVVPAAFGLAVFARQAPLRLAGLAVGVIGMAAMLLTKSRAPGLLLLAALPLVVAAGVALRAITARAAIGGAVLGACLLGAALMPFMGDIVERFREDLGESVDFRAEYNRAALMVFDEAPLLGVGFGASSARMAELVPLVAMELQSLAEVAATANVRAAAPVHNLYLLMLAEAGALGLAAFVLLLLAATARGLRALAGTDGAARGLCLGFTIGILLQAVQQTVDFSFWIDPGWYSFALVLALLGTAPRLWGRAA
jgi:O-antigen ligase